MAQKPRLCLMAVHAHPDDEVVSTGGTLARYAHEGIETVLVCATRGEEGEIHDPDLDPVEAQPRLAEIRTQELRCAQQALGISAVEFLDYRDSGMAGTPPNEHAASFHQADLTEATTRLVRLIRRYRPDVLTTYNAFGSYGHPDHKKVHHVTHAAFERAGDPTFADGTDQPPWQPHKLYETETTIEEIELWRAGAERRAEEKRKESGGGAEPEQTWWNEEFFQEMKRNSRRLADITTSIEVVAYRDQQRAAFRCHRTQFAHEGDFFEEAQSAPPELANFERFTRARTLVDAPDREDDLFAGLR
jgi:LmbE family N-acetylglucosaminyl deacetylase